MQKRVEDYVAKWDMLEKGDKVIVGVSGGADSVCLLFVLLELQKKISFELLVVHVNHNLRGEEANADERYVKQLCQEVGIECRVYSKDVETIARERRLSVEEAGRDVRREVFSEVMQSCQGTKIALAHHMNDNVETFLMNVARGSGLKGLGGIRPVTGTYIRPLLCLERREIETYLNERGISYCTDTSNSSDVYLRNRVRKYLIPFMEKEMNAQATSHISETMRQLMEIQNYIEEETEKYWEFCVREEKSGYILLEENFFEVPKVIQPFIIKSIMAKLSGKEKDLGEVHIQNIQELLTKQVGRKIDLPYGIRAKRVYEGLFLAMEFKEMGSFPTVYLNFEETDTQEFYWQDWKVTCRLRNEIPTAEKLKQKSNTKWFNYDIMGKELCVRTRRMGDYITIHPDGRTQKLKSFYVNEKIPQERRDKILLLADGNHIVWVEDLRVNTIYGVNEHTKRVLEIQIDKGEREGYGRDN